MQTTDQTGCKTQRTNIAPAIRENVEVFQASASHAERLMIACPADFQTVSPTPVFLRPQSLLYPVTTLGRTHRWRSEVPGEVRIVVDETGQVRSTQLHRGRVSGMFDLCLRTFFQVVSRDTVSARSRWRKARDFLAAWLENARGDENFPMSHARAQSFSGRHLLPRLLRAPTALRSGGHLRRSDSVFAENGIYESHSALGAMRACRDVTEQKTRWFEQRHRYARTLTYHDWPPLGVRSITDLGSPDEARPLKEFGRAKSSAEPGPTRDIRVPDLHLTPPCSSEVTCASVGLAIGHERRAMS